MIAAPCLLALLPAAAAAEAPALDRPLLEKRLAAAESAKDWPAALDAARELDALAEADHAETLFRVARLHALLPEGGVDTVLMGPASCPPACTIS